MRKILLLLLLVVPCHAKVVIWDLGNVLFEQSRFGIARSIGLGKFFSYAFLDRQSMNIQPLLMDVLDTFGSQTGPELMRCPKGIALPNIMVDWQKGAIHGYDLMYKALDKVEELDRESFFVSHRERDLLIATLEKIFDPHVLASHTFPLWQGVRLLEECAARGHTLVVLSNWDPATFELVYHNHRGIFDLFDHVFISGYTGKVKPHRTSFEQVLATCHVAPEDCFFIDDQPENIKAARRLNIPSFRLRRSDYRGLRKVLRSHNIL